MTFKELKLPNTYAVSINRLDPDEERIICAGDMVLHHITKNGREILTPRVVVDIVETRWGLHVELRNPTAREVEIVADKHAA